MLLIGVKNKKGVILFISLGVIAIISMFALLSSTGLLSEQKMAGNTKRYVEVFYNAESGLKHVAKELGEKYGEFNSRGTSGSWSFALDGSTFTEVSSSVYCEGCLDGSASLASGDWLDNGVEVLSESTTKNNVTYTYTVHIWDNDESSETGIGCPDLDPSFDCDGLIIARSESVAQINSEVIARSVQETTLLGQVSGLSIINTTPQAGGGGGKGSESSDVADISTVSGSGVVIN
ncbi:MAG: pilus assembly PilX N-terminal domain-containing protein [Nitrospinota bacterium]